MPPMSITNRKIAKQLHTTKLLAPLFPKVQKSEKSLNASIQIRYKRVCLVPKSALESISHWLAYSQLTKMMLLFNWSATLRYHSSIEVKLLASLWFPVLSLGLLRCYKERFKMREIVHIQAGQCGNQIGAKVSYPIKYFITPVIDKEELNVRDRLIKMNIGASVVHWLPCASAAMLSEWNGQLHWLSLAVIEGGGIRVFHEGDFMMVLSTKHKRWKPLP
ncbi:hypothetical protein ACTXT7_005802 [Hymenolepis weldensis]